MSRLPFDPSRAKGGKGPDPRPASSDKHQLTVSQVAAQIRTTLADAFPGKIRVVGEVSNLRDRNHLFFSIKDDNAALRCVCFASAARKLPVRIADGMQVLVTGRVDFYDAQGSVQIYVDRIEPLGQGALEQALRQRIEQLRERGYFDPDHKKPLPAFPRKIAVVTSRSAAALQDVIDTARRRHPGCQLYLLDVRVQGDAAASEIASAITALATRGPSLSIDAIILTRGGGSIEDLWPFNEQAVADAVYNCSLPIVAAIGHETDTTIAELVADHRCATPTQAAMHLVPDRATHHQQLSQLASRLTLLLQREHRHQYQRLDAVARHTLFRAPHRLTESARDRLTANAKRLARLPAARLASDQQYLLVLEARLTRALPRHLAPSADRLRALDEKLTAALPRRLTAAVDRTAAAARHLEAVSPYNVLARGYSCTLGPDGRLLRSIKTASPGDPITTILSDGRLQSRVESDNATASTTSTSAPTKPRPRKRKPKPSADDQPSLF